MNSAIDLAKESFDLNEVPVGAVVIKDGNIIGKGRNSVIANNDVSSHAEINAIRSASQNIVILSSVIVWSGNLGSFSSLKY